MATRHNNRNSNMEVSPDGVLGVVGGEEVYGDRDSWESRAEELFTLCDREAKGFVTKRDMQRLWGELPLSPDEFEAVFDSLDEDHNGYLSLEEFTDGLGRHLGLVVKFEAETTPSTNSIPCETKGETNAVLGENMEQNQSTIAQEHITTLVDKLLSDNQDSGSSEAQLLWQQLNEGLDLSSDTSTVDIENLVTSLLKELLRIRSEHLHLEGTLRTKTEQYNQEVSRLHAELDGQLAQVHHHSQVETEQQVKDKRRMNLLQQNIDDREASIKMLEEELNKVRKDLHLASDREGQLKQKNTTLQIQVEHFEEELRLQENELNHVTSALNATRRASKDEKKNRFKQALQVSEGIAIERESLVEQLDMLRNINLQLRDSHDLNDMQASQTNQQTCERASEFDWSVSSPGGNSIDTVDEEIMPQPLQQQTLRNQSAQPKKSSFDLEHDEDYFKKEALSYIQDWNMIDTSSQILDEMTKDFSCMKKKAEDFCENVYAILSETDIEKPEVLEEISEEPGMAFKSLNEEAVPRESTLLQELLPQLPLCAACGSNLASGEDEKMKQRREMMEEYVSNTPHKENIDVQNIDGKEEIQNIEEDAHIQMGGQKEELKILDKQIFDGQYKLLRKEDISHLCICKRSIGYGRRYHSSLLIFLPENGKCNHNCPQHGKQQIYYKCQNVSTEVQNTLSTFNGLINTNGTISNAVDNSAVFNVDNFHNSKKIAKERGIQTENDYHIILKRNPEMEMYNINIEELIAKYTEGEYIDSEIYKIQNEYKSLLEMNVLAPQLKDTSIQTDDFICEHCCQKNTEELTNLDLSSTMSDDIHEKNICQTLKMKDASTSTDFFKNSMIIQQKKFKNEYFREVATLSQNSVSEKPLEINSLFYDVNPHKKISNSCHSNKLLSSNPNDLNESVINNFKFSDNNLNDIYSKDIQCINENLSSNMTENTFDKNAIGKENILQWPIRSSRLEENRNVIYSPKPRMFKVVFLGDSGVGKTCFIHRCNTHEYRSDFAATVGVDYQNVSVNVGSTEVRMQLWDTAGQERFKAITKQYYRKADGIVVMYDITNERSFLNVADWISQVKETCGDVVVAVVGNKKDLSVGRKISKNTAFVLAKQYECVVYEASAASGAGVLEVMKHLAALLTNNQEHQLATSSALSLHKQENYPQHTKKKCC